jgi:hypothetical protein
VKWLVGLVVASLLLVGAPAAAAEDDQLRALYDAGAQAYKQGKFLAAAEAFEAAYQVSPKPQLLFSTAQAYRRQFAVDGDQEHGRRAIAFYRRYLADVGEGERRLEAAEAIERLREQVDEENPAPAPPPKRATRLTITTAVEGARGSLDGGPLRDMPLIEEVSPGTHTVVVTAPGYRKKRRAIVAVEGAVVAAQIELDEIPATVKLKGADGAEVIVDGRESGSLPRPLLLPSGRHVITLLELGHEPLTLELDVARGAEVVQEVELTPTRLRTASYVVTGTGGAGLIVAGVLMGLALAAEADAQAIGDARAAGARRTEADRVELNDAIARRDDLRLAAGIAAGTAGAMAVAGVLLFLVDSPTAPPYVAPAGDEAPAEAAPLEVSAAPLLSPTGFIGAGASLFVRF